MDADVKAALWAQRHLLAAIFCTIVFTVAGMTLLRAKAALHCDTYGYRAGTYLALCGLTPYGDYEHGAILYGLEPNVLGYIHDADVLFLGSSRTQFAFSTNAIRRYFSDRSIKHYLLGFAYGESSEFPLAILDRARPTAKVLVINADPFFHEGVSPPGREVLDGSLSVRVDYLLKKAFQPIHRRLCGAFPKLCSPPTRVAFRSVETGEWILEGHWTNPNLVIPIDPAKQVQFPPSMSEEARAKARAFMARVNVDPACVIITEVPTGNQRAGTLPADTAEAIGARLIAPTVDGLATVDNAHLTRESAERWSTAFLQAAEDVIWNCTRNRTEHVAGVPGAR